MRRVFLLLVFLTFAIEANSQIPNKPSSIEIHESIKKLNFLGSVLYIAAHPDDENTSLISYFSNDIKARTAYLSLTRGDGGQNLIGSEIRELLGVIRTQELLAARKTDGGEQMFTRANDFGYSKHPVETLEVWNKEEVLSDVVLAIRKFQPDIIINRFSHKPESFGKTHGHHTSSAVLSAEAFDLAGNKSRYTEQLKYVDVWQPRREFFNTSWWFYGSRENFDKADKTKLLEINTGTYYPASGLSNNEVSSLSRSMHKSQGFGSTGSRGNTSEYLELVKGDLPKDKTNLFDGINTTWSRVKGGKEIGELLSIIEKEYDFTNPSASIEKLMMVYQLIQALENDHWKNQKSEETKLVIQACAGLFLEAAAKEAFTTRRGEVIIDIEAINRSEATIKLKSVGIGYLDKEQIENSILKNNENHKFEIKGIIPEDIEYTSAYWLREDGSLGMYKVSDRELIGLPQAPRELTAIFELEINGVSISIDKDIVYKYNDPVKGEVYRPFEILPEVTAKISDNVIIFAGDDSKEIKVKVKAWKSNLKGIISLDIPNEWEVSPANFVVDIAEKGIEESFTFILKPPNFQSEGEISPKVEINGTIFSDELIEIEYDHIPFQSVLMRAKSKIVRLDIHKNGQLIGYIQGAGDEIPASLRQVGYTVVELNEDEITIDNLQNFDAIILGVRAYNTNNKAKFYQETLHDYAKGGGTLIVQYNTNFRLKVDAVAPMEINLSRDRVTDENSEVIILEPNHEVMQFPNKITEKDFEGWVQERGLYFPDVWSSDFTPLLSMHDKGESSKDGSLLVAKYGEGYFIYTGLSFFRELPAGVPGAYRLYTNLLSVGKNKKDELKD